MIKNRDAEFLRFISSSVSSTTLVTFSALVSLICGQAVALAGLAALNGDKELHGLYVIS